MAITKDALLLTSRKLLTVLKELLDQTDLPESAPVLQQAQTAIDNAEDIIGEELT
jgi:hypothetical protein